MTLTLNLIISPLQLLQKVAILKSITETIGQSCNDTANSMFVFCLSSFGKFVKRHMLPN